MFNRKVSYAKVHQDLFIQGIGSLGSTLPPSITKNFDLTMTTNPIGIALYFHTVSKTYEAVVPWANVIIANLAPLEPAESAVKKAS